MALLIREVQPSELGELQTLLATTVQTINCRDYDALQIKMWSAAAMNPDFWGDRLQTHSIYVAEAVGQLVGFTSLEPDGHIDFMYVHHQHQGEGIASHLLQHVEAIAQSRSITRLYAEVSITAEPFFSKRGFHITQAEQVTRRGVMFRRFKMEKSLTHSST